MHNGFWAGHTLFRASWRLTRWFFGRKGRVPRVTPGGAVLWPRGQGPRHLIAGQFFSKQEAEVLKGLRPFRYQPSDMGHPARARPGQGQGKARARPGQGQGNMGHLTNGWLALPFLYSSRIERYGGRIPAVPPPHQHERKVVGVRRLITLLAVVGAMLVLYAGGVLAQEAPQDRGAEPYIVVFKGETVAKPGQAASAMARRDNLSVGFVYRHALEGFSAVIPQTKLDEVRADSRVKYIEHDGKMHAFAQTLPWGINKIDADSSSTAAGDGTGAITNVNAYVIDTGIDAGHTDLNVTRNVNFAGGPNTDCNGHGTHVAGTVAAKDNAQDVVGGAPGVPLTGVKVLGCSGSGSYSGVIAGIDWVKANAARPAVANMSLGGPTSNALDEAVRRSAT